jgi:hypothetical protein
VAAKIIMRAKCNETGEKYEKNIKAYYPQNYEQLKLFYEQDYFLL